MTSSSGYSLEAFEQRVGQPLHQPEILPGPGLERRAERVEHALARVRALDHGLDQRRLELRLGEHAGGIELRDPRADLLQPLRSGPPRRVDGDRAERVGPVAPLEVLIGVVEHDVGPVADGGQALGEGAVELVQPLAQPRRVGRVARAHSPDRRRRAWPRSHRRAPWRCRGPARRACRSRHAPGAGPPHGRHRRRQARPRARAPPPPTCRLPASHAASGPAPPTAPRPWRRRRASAAA